MPVFALHISHVPYLMGMSPKISYVIEDMLFSSLVNKNTNPKIEQNFKN